MANKKRLIDANWILGEIEHDLGCYEIGEMTEDDALYVELKDVVKMVCAAPTIDDVEVVHGYWIERQLDNFRKYEVKCSECGFIGISDYDQYLEPIDFYFCPRCGARMDRLDGDGNG